MPDNTLQDLRKQIEQLDREVLEVLARRFVISRKIGSVKQKWSLPVEDETREAQLLQENLQAASQLGLRITFVRDLTRLLLDHSRELQEEA